MPHRLAGWICCWENRSIALCKQNLTSTQDGRGTAQILITIHSSKSRGWTSDSKSTSFLNPESQTPSHRVPGSYFLGGSLVFAINEFP